MSNIGILQKAPTGAIGFDWNGKLTLAQAKQFYNKGYRFCIRYVSRTPGTHQSNLTSGAPDLALEETQDILNAGLALMVVQHVDKSGWQPTMSLGKTYGDNAAAIAASAGVLQGTNVWLDLEDIPNGTNQSDIIDYCNTWSDSVIAGGYEPGIYVGFNVWLSPDELFFKLKFKHYWRAAGDIPQISHRGYQLFQHVDKTPDGQLDRNVAVNDAFGDSIVWQTLNLNSA
jgi:glycoside hydrolase-like protein